MPTFVRIYTGDDGRSYIEDVEPPFDRSIDPEGAMEGTPLEGAAGITFRRSPPGHFQDFHTAPRRQYTITLSGEIEVETGDGTVRRFGPGTVILAEDLTGEGHTTKVVSDEPRIFIVVPLER
jgi:hypothetical protein